MYFIPRNIKTRFEFFEGFGFLELFLFLMFAAVGGSISYIVYLFTKKFFSIMFLVLFGAVGLVAVRKDPRLGVSAFDLMREYRHFSSKQKSYYYHFGTGREGS